MTGRAVRHGPVHTNNRPKDGRDWSKAMRRQPESAYDRRARQAYEEKQNAPRIAENCQSCDELFSDKDKRERLNEYRWVEWAGVLHKQGAKCSDCVLRERVESLEQDAAATRRRERDVASTCQNCGGGLYWRGTTTGTHCQKHCSKCPGCHCGP